MTFDQFKQRAEAAGNGFEIDQLCTDWLRDLLNDDSKDSIERAGHAVIDIVEDSIK